MHKQNDTLAKNFAVLLSSQFVTWILTLVLMVFLPRYLGAANVGKLFLAVAVWTVLSVVMTFGSDQFAVKAIARDRSRMSVLFGTKVLLSTILFVLCMTTLYFVLRYFDYPTITIYVILLIGLEFWIWGFVNATESVLQGIEQMEHISIGRILGHIFTVSVGVTLLLLGGGIFTICVVRIVSTLLIFGVQYVMLKRTTDMLPQVDPKLLGTLLKEGWPYFLTSISMVAYMQLDIVILSALVNEETIGWYGIADQLFGTLLFIPTAFIISAYPVYAKLSVNELEPLKKLLAKNFDSMLLIGVPMGLGLFLVGNQIVLLLYGAEFAKSGPVLSAFGIVLILTYLNMLVGQFLIAIDRQKPWAFVMAVALLLTIPLDYWLIPWTHSEFQNGALGGAFAFIITELGMLICGFALLPKGTLGRANVQIAIKIFAAGLVMVCSVWWLREYFLSEYFLQEYFVAIPIVSGVLVYVGMVLLLRIVPKEDIESVKEMAQGLIARITRREIGVASH